MISRLVIVGFVTAGLLGCEPRYPDLDLSDHHPAEPDAHSGAAIMAPAALRPELTTAVPQLLRLVPGKPAPNVGLPPSPKPTAPTSGSHNMHKK